MNISAFQGWVANLSDGTSVTETEAVPGEKSAWQKLLQRCRDTDVKIVGMRLFRFGFLLVALPHKQCDGYFQAYEASKTWFSAQEGTKQGVGSVVGDKIFITWISGNGIVSQDIRPLSENKIHTTLA